MKNITQYAVIAASAAFALVSCSKEIDNPVQNENPAEGGIKVTVVAGTPETKTSITGIDATHAEIAWQNEDKFGFVNVAVPEDNLAEIQSIDGSGAATIEGSVTTAGTFFAYYPKSKYAPTSDGAVLRIQTAQTPPDGTTFDPAADVLVSTTFDVAPAGSATTPATIQFKRLGAFLKVSFQDNTTGSILSGEFVKKVSVQSSAVSLAAKLTLNSTGIVSAAGAEKTITATYDDMMYIISNAGEAAYLGVQPVTLPAGSDLIVNVETDKYYLSKSVTLGSDIVLNSGDIKPIKVGIGDAQITPKVPALERVWGFYEEDSTPWYAVTNITGGSIAHPEGYGMARTLAMDDDYVYLPKSSGYPLIPAVSINDKATQISVVKTGISGGSTFATSCARMIKNTDPSVNDGKDVLLVCNLTSTDSDANQLRLYAYKDGVDAAPTQIAGFCYDSANSTNDWRRYGDRFFVTGTWQDGKVYFPSFNANKTVVLSIANGARTAVTQIAAGAANSPDGIKDLTVYPGSDNLFLTNTSIANLVAPTGGKVSGWDEYTLSGSSANGVGTWGYNFFSFNGKDYIAYARISGSKAWIEVIEDKGDLLTSLADQDGLIKSPIHSASNLDAEHATGGVADCCVREINGEVYIAALTRDGGLVLDKMVLK